MKEKGEFLSRFLKVLAVIAGADQQVVLQLQLLF